MAHAWNAEIDWRRQRQHRLRNLLQSVLLILGMAALLAACGWIVAGVQGVLLTVLFGGLGLMASSAVSPGLILHLFGAQPLPDDLTDIHLIVTELAKRAGLAEPPRLYTISSPTLNAFSVGRRDAAAITMTSGLLRSLTLRELAGVLAHEISHIHHNDLWVMGLADVISRLTRSLSLLGMILLVLNLPLAMAGGGQIPWLLVLLLIFAPSLGTLLQLALSRTREFDADLEAVALTGDPEGLAAALQKLERQAGRFWEDILLPGRRSPDPSVLRTHPHTEERVRRLQELRATGHSPLDIPRPWDSHWHRVPENPPRPRWRRSGLWY